MALTFLENVGKAFVFKKLRPTLREFLMKAGYEDVPYSFFGVLFYVTAFVTFIVYFTGFYPYLLGKSPVVILLLTFLFWACVQLAMAFVVVLVLYTYLDLKIYRRTKEMEQLIPDYLQLVSTNLKGGMSFEKSLWAAIHPEFKVLAKEITIVSKKVLTGNDLGEALAEFTKKYDSPILRRSMELIIGEVTTGGKISQVIDEVVETLRRTRSLREEMAANTLTYVIFIGAIVIVIAPALFALSYQLLNIVVGFTAQISATDIASSSLPFSISKVSLDPAAFKTFSYIALGIIAICTSLIVSIIQKGDMKGGLKYVPLFLILSLLCYALFTYALGQAFGSIAFGA